MKLAALAVPTVAAALTLAAALVAARGSVQQATPVPLDYYRLVPGFLPEIQDPETGTPKGSGFAEPNPWGAYTAYLLTMNAKGQRTWRIENLLPNANGTSSQGSTCYLFEGAERALLVDTAQNTADTPGRNDLKTLVRYLLAHENDGRPRTNPVDFVVANTHAHGDHTGKNTLMSDRTVYYPALDWPRANAPANYVPIKEGGGPTDHGQAVGEIALGQRTVVAIDVPEHTPGSTAYLDRENQMVATGDALGSAYVWAQFGFITQYAHSVHHLQDVVRPFDRLIVLPAHFYQNQQGARVSLPPDRRPVDKAYIDDEAKVADAILAGTVTSEPYRVVGRNAVIATVGHAQVAYTLAQIHTGGILASTGDASTADQAAYHAVAIPGTPGRPGAPPDARYGAIDRIRSGFFLIRDYANQSLYLLEGTSRALLIGSGSGTPGLEAFVSKLAGGLPLDVIATSDDPGQVGGLSQFASHKVYLPKGVAAPNGVRTVAMVGEGDVISLGNDRAGRPLTLEVHPLAGHSAAGLTLLDTSDRLLFSGDALGTQAPDGGLVLHETLTHFGAALTAWRARTDGKYDLVYTAHNYQWFTSPAYVDEVQSAVAKGIAAGGKVMRSDGAADIVASVVVADDGGR